MNEETNTEYLYRDVLQGNDSQITLKKYLKLLIGTCENSCTILRFESQEELNIPLPEILHSSTESLFGQNSQLLSVLVILPKIILFGDFNRGNIYEIKGALSSIFKRRIELILHGLCFMKRDKSKNSFNWHKLQFSGRDSLSYEIPIVCQVLKSIWLDVTLPKEPIAAALLTVHELLQNNVCSSSNKQIFNEMQKSLIDRFKYIKLLTQIDDCKFSGEKDFPCFLAANDIPFSKQCSLSILTKKVIGMNDELECHQVVVKKVLYWIMENKDFIFHWCLLDFNQTLTTYEQSSLSILKQYEKLTFFQKSNFFSKHIDPLNKVLTTSFVDLMRSALIRVLTQCVEDEDSIISTVLTA